MEIISRAEAKACGLIRFFTGVPCKHGHTCERFVSSKGCLICNRLRGRKPENSGRSRAYHFKNRDTILPKMRERERRRSFAKNPDRCTRNRTAREAKATAKKLGLSQYFTGIPCKHGHISPRFVSNNQCTECLKQWERNNPEKVRTGKRKWENKNREHVRAKSRVHAHTRRARKQNAGGQHTIEEIVELFKKQKGRCANPCCRRSLKKKYHIDHIVPVIRGGSSDIGNIQLLCPSCNLKKRDKTPAIWAAENGLLL